ncbi:MAG: hypothetical protein ACAI37_21530 [Chthoniobacter sp.]
MHRAFPPIPSTPAAAPQQAYLSRWSFPVAALRTAGVVFLLFTLTFQARAADPAWHALVGTFATFQAPPDLVRNANTMNVNGNIEIYDCPDFSLTFESGAGALLRETQSDFAKALAYWSTERRKNWRVNTYLEDDQHLAYAAIRTVDDPAFRDPRPFHLSFGLAAGDKPFSIHIRFHQPEDLVTIERVLQSLKLKTL